MNNNITKNILSGYSSLVLAELAGGVSALLIQVTLARSLDPRDYGRFALLNALLQFLLVASTGGAPQALRWLVGRDGDDLHRAYRWVLTRHLACISAFGLLLALVSELIDASSSDSELRHSLRLAALDFVLRAGVIEPFLLLLNACARCGDQARVFVLFWLLRLAGIYVATSCSSGLVGPMCGLAAASCLSAGLAYARLSPLASAIVPATVGTVEPIGPIVWRFLRLNALSDAIMPLTLGLNLLASRASNTDALGLAALGACQSTIQGPLAVGRAVLSSSYPGLVGSIARSERDVAASLLGSGMRRLFFLNGLPVALCFGLGDPIIRGLFGARFLGYGRLEFLVVAAGFSFAVIGLLGGVLTAAGDLRGRLEVLLLVASVSVPSAYVLSLGHGAIGAASGLALGGATGMFEMARRASGMVGPFVPWYSMGRCAAVSASIAFLAGTLPVSGPVYLPCLVASLCIVYSLACLKLKVY